MDWKNSFPLKQYHKTQTIFLAILNSFKTKTEQNISYKFSADCAEMEKVINPEKSDFIYKSEEGKF